MTSSPNLTQQTALYGAPVAESVHRIMGTLGISQAAVSRTIGVSAPMLSQLVSGQRIKIGSPLAVQRLQSLLDLADEVDSGLAHEAVVPRLAAIGAESSTTLTTRRREHAEQDRGPDAVQRLLRAVASGRELAAAADVLDAEHRGLAEVLRVYGTGGTDEVRAHWDGLAPLV